MRVNNLILQYTARVDTVRLLIISNKMIYKLHVKRMFTDNVLSKFPSLVL